jgi:hypothetical protein
MVRKINKNYVRTSRPSQLTCELLVTLPIYVTQQKSGIIH